MLPRDSFLLSIICLVFNKKKRIHGSCIFESQKPECTAVDSLLATSISLAHVRDASVKEETVFSKTVTQNTRYSVNHALQETPCASRTQSWGWGCCEQIKVQSYGQAIVEMH